MAPRKLVTSDTESIEDSEVLALHLTRRQVLKRAAALGLAGVAIPGLLASCAGDDDDEPADEDPVDQPDDDEDAAAEDEEVEEEDDDVEAGEATDFISLTSNQPSTLDPAIGADHPTWKVFVGVYEPLIDHELGTADVENLEGVLAESWEVSADGLTYSFMLRESVLFHDGSEFSADDVKASYDRVKEIGLGRSWILDPLDEVRVVSPQEVELVLENVYSPFLLGVPLVYIVSSAAIEANEMNGDLAQDWFSQNTAGTGPYQLAEFAVGERLLMERFDDYWGGWEGNHFDRVILILVEEAATQRIMLEGGEGDLAESLSPGDLRDLSEREEFFVTDDPVWSIFWLMMNTHLSPTDDPRFRQAMRLAFPYEEMIRDVMLGRGVVPEGYLPPGFFAHDGSPPEVSDLDRAQELLEESGNANGDIELSLVYFSGFDWQRQAAELLSERLRPFGITVTIQGSPWPTMLEILQDPGNTVHLAYYSASPSTSDPDSTLHQTFHSGSTHWSNFGYGNPELDVLLDEARIELDPDERVRLYQQAQALLQEDFLAINTMVATSDHAFRANIQGYVHHPPYTYGPVRYYSLWK